MNKRLLSVAIIAATLMTATAKNDDPVLMTINGKKVPLSEFEYLYNKNNSQQVQQQTIDEYVDMFVTYKLKVADAEAAGIDTTQAFIREYNGYCNELAKPYMRDNSVEEALIAKAYSHMSEDVDVSHIMLPLGMNPSESDSLKQKLDDIRTQILNGADFGELALKHSTDGSAKINKGHMGFITAGRYPYTFEDAAYDTKVGEISSVIETQFGYHIVKVHERRPSKGQVHAKHILKLTHGATPEKATKAKEQIDSIYNLLISGADFTQMAINESECGSAERGGDLGWFGSGHMIPEFENVAFNLEKGQFSEPLKTRFGYHIILKVDEKGIPTFEESRKKIENAIRNDERCSMADKAKLKDLKAEHNSHLNEKALKTVKEELAKNNGYDSTFIKKHINSTLTIGHVGKMTFSLGDVIKTMPTTAKINIDNGYGLIKTTAEHLLDNKTVEYEISALKVKNDDFRNLTNEYRDGMLLFEISNRNVWEKASKDKAGLEAYFQKNKYKYYWDGPKYKGFIIFTANDSVMTKVKKFLDENKLENDSVTKVLRKQFGREIKVDKVLAAKGENEIVDNIAFNGKKPTVSNGKWRVFSSYNGKIISWPEEAADVRGPVTSDYQTALEKAWIKSLRAKYPVKINQKVLNKVKEK